MNIPEWRLPLWEVFFKQLEQEPFMRTTEFLRYLDVWNASSANLRMVEVDKIIGCDGSDLKSWRISEHSAGKIWQHALLLEVGLNQQTPHLLEYQGAFFVKKGRHLVAAIKGMIRPQSTRIAAYVSKLSPIAVARDEHHVLRYRNGDFLLPRLMTYPSDLLKLFQRSQLRLWQGRLLEVETSDCPAVTRRLYGGPVKSIKWNVEWAVGPFAFAEDLPKAAAIWRRVTKG